MHASVRHSALAALLGLSLAAAAAADGGFYLPQAPAGPGGEDSIETSGGTRCRQSINGNGAYLDVGLAGTRSKGQSDINDIVRDHDRQSDQALGYARMIVPLGKKPKRIDCTRIYEMEIARMQREIELLKLAAE